MSVDYHIYIHSGSGGIGGGTKPFENRKDNDWDMAARDVASGIEQLGNLENAGGKIASAGASALTKAFPIVAVAVAAVTVAGKVIEAGFESYSSVTGNYEYDIKVNNAKTTLHNILNPVGVWRNYYKRNIEFRNLNIESNEKRQLLGATLLPIGKVGV